MFAPSVTMTALLAALILNAAIADGTDPTETMELAVAALETASTLPESTQGNSRTARDEVGDFLRQYGDLDLASRIILADHWDSANAGQRAAFRAALEQRVVTMLLGLIVDLDFSRVAISPFEGDSSEIPIEMRVSVPTADGARIKFNLRLHDKTGEWRILDAIAEGVSYLKLFRSEFRQDAARHGLERAIDRFRPQGVE